MLDAISVLTAPPPRGTSAQGRRRNKASARVSTGSLSDHFRWHMASPNALLGNFVPAAAGRPWDRLVPWADQGPREAGGRPRVPAHGHTRLAHSDPPRAGGTDTCSSWHLPACPSPSSPPGGAAGSPETGWAWQSAPSQAASV